MSDSIQGIFMSITESKKLDEDLKKFDQHLSILACRGDEEAYIVTQSAEGGGEFEETQETTYR